MKQQSLRTILLGALVGASAMAAESNLDVRVMSFNIRFGTAEDGENHWDKRRELLAGTIRAFDPDLLGTQETLEFQRDFLASRLPGHEASGVGRDDGKSKGEMAALFYRRERFEKLDGGHFWLSDTPEVPGSVSWDSSLTRMATWVRLRDRRAPAARPILFLNTHFDHRGPRARLESARMLRARLETLGTGCRWVVTGDFNAGEGSEPYRAFFAAAGDQPSPLVDSFRLAHPARGPGEGTTCKFQVAAVDGPRIDWIAISRDWTVAAATIDHTHRDGRTPSDHFPVSAVLAPGPQ